MAALKRERINWTQTDYILLVEAVIKVEEEIMNEIDESTRTIRPPSGRQTPGNLRSIATAVDKWARIAKLIPGELQTKSSSKHKCKGVFFELLRVYKDKIAGNNTARSRRIISKPVWEIITKREELSKPCSSNRRPNPLIQWTEPAHLLLIEAVIRVEDEDRWKKTNCSIRSSTGKQTRKWERIANFLHSKLPGNCHRQMDNIENKCRDGFFDLMKSYRAIVRGGSEGPEGPIRMTKSVFQMMKRREDLLNAPRSMRDETSLQTASNRISSSTHSGNDPEHSSQTSKSFVKMHTNQEHLPEGRSMGTATQSAATIFPELTNDLETTVESLSFESDAEEEAKNDIINEEKSLQNTNEIASSKNASGPLCKDLQDSANQKRPAVSILELYMRSKRRKRDPGILVKLPPGVGHISKFSRAAGRTKFRSESDAKEEPKNDIINEEKSMQSTNEIASSKNASGSLCTDLQDSENQNCPALSTPELYMRSKRRERDPGNLVKLSPGVGHTSKFSRAAGRTKFIIFLQCTRT